MFYDKRPVMLTQMGMKCTTCRMRVQQQIVLARVGRVSDDVGVCLGLSPAIYRVTGQLANTV